MAKPPSRKHQTGANLLQSKLPCPECGSSDALSIYDDGHGFCFSHGKIVPLKVLQAEGLWEGGAIANKGGTPPKPSAELEQFLSSSKCQPISARKLTLATTKRWDYRVRRNPHKHVVESLALYRDKAGKVIAVKVRTEETKDFRWEGKSEKALLFGQHMWGSGGKYLIITEGEYDAMTVGQVLDHKYPVVSVQGGAAGAAKALTNQLEWVNSFEKIVLMFDMDEPGQEAAQACAALLAPGRAHIAFLPEKDASDCLVNGKEEEIRQGFWQAKRFRPDGIVDARELTAACKKKIEVGKPWPWEFMSRWTFGRRPGEVYTLGSGTGMGKSDFMAEFVANHILGKTKEGRQYEPSPMALFNYEQPAAHMTKLLVAGKLASRRFHIPNMPEYGFDAGWTEEERDHTLAVMDGEIWNRGGKLFINFGNGLADWESIISRCRHLRHAEDVRDFVIDPVGAIVADNDDEENQVKFLDKLFRQAASLAQELQACLYMVSHLTRPAFGPSHEEGGQVRLSQFRGSNGIGMFSNYVFGLERNQQAETDLERKTAVVRVVKDRYTGLSTGKTDRLFYDELAGTLDTINTGTGI